MSLINTLNDLSWDLLDVLHLGEFFDSHGIPPILFPIMLIGIVLLVLFLLLVPLGGESAAECGDGLCSPGETEESCPDDCAVYIPPPADEEQEEKTIRVYLSGALTCRTLNVVLKDGEGNVIDSRMDTGNRAVTFQNVVAERVSVEASSDYSTQPAVSAGPINTKNEDVLRVNLPDDYCSETTDYGSIRVIVRDSQTSQPMGANVALFDSGDTLRGTKFIDGEGTFTNLVANNWYYLTATYPGYQDYNGVSNSIFVEKNQEKIATINMVPAVSPPDATGKLEVCVTGDGEPIEHSGEIGIYSVDDSLIAVGRLSDCSLFRGEATGEGCYIFTLPAGSQVYAGINRAPSSCSAGGRAGPIIIPENDKVFTTIELNCSLVGSIRAVVYGNNSQVLTDQCTVELYHENGTKITTMTMSDDGEHTEYVTLGAGLEVYVYAKNAPPGYLETRSGDVDIDEDENKTVSITLDTPPPPLPNLTIINPQVSPQVLHSNETFMVTASAVRISGTMTTLTPDDGVVVSCESSWGETVTANYSGLWECNLTAPNSVGEKTIVLRATKADANEDVRSVTVRVINDSIGALYITEKSRSPLAPVVLSFNITYLHNNTEIRPVQSIYESNLLVYFRKDTFRGLVANLTNLNGANGLFTTSFFVPFKGIYDYELSVKALTEDKLSVGYLSGRLTITQGVTNSLSCSVSENLLNPGDALNVTASFAPLNGVPLPEQRVMVSVTGRFDSSTTPLVWNSSGNVYKQEVLAMPSECKQIVNCSSMDDPSIWSSTEIYVADSNAANANPVDCHITDPYSCMSLNDVRDCYKFLKENPNLVDPLVQNIRQCARNGLPFCNQPNFITCEVEPPIIGPGQVFRVSALSSPGQSIQADISAGQDSLSGPLVWNSSGEVYEQQFLSMPYECKQIVNCSSLTDPGTWATTELYVVDATTGNKNNCPVSNPTLCNSLSAVRDCYKYLLEAPGASIGDLQTALVCAFNGLPSCNQPNAITCEVQPKIVRPGGNFNVSATFGPVGGATIPNQHLQATIMAGPDSSSSALAWDASEGIYKQQLVALSPECRQIVNCSSVDDPSIWTTTELYVVNPDTIDVSAECPSSSCSSLTEVRNCYKYLIDNNLMNSPSDLSTALACAQGGLQSCSASPPEISQCYQGLSLKVQTYRKDRRKNRNDCGRTGQLCEEHTNTTDTLYFRVMGTPSGNTVTLNYQKRNVTTAVRNNWETIESGYRMLDIHLPGGRNEPIADALGPRTTPITTRGLELWIDSATGVLTARAYCPLSQCGAPGNLNANEDDVVDIQDVEIMATIIDTLEILGAPPYSPWPMSCVDVNGDGVVTRQDLDCISGLANHYYSSPDDCPRCQRTSTLEICHDGVDNDCDGQVDRDTYSRGHFYSFTGTTLADLCVCSSLTPCSMLYDADGIEGISSEEDVIRCSSIDGGPYTWKSPNEWQCNSSNNGASLHCGGNSYSCSGGTGVWLKLGQPSGTYPPNPQG